jgi:ATP-dependent Clp protease adaptor protein ClpS
MVLAKRMRTPSLASLVDSADRRARARAALGPGLDYVEPRRPCAGPSGGTHTPAPGSSPTEEVEVEERKKTAAPKKFKVIFHNDDYTTMEYVIEVLRRFFHKNETEALHIMLTVHKKGKGVAGVYPRDVAETKVSEVMQDARERGHPLLVTAEPE